MAAADSPTRVGYLGLGSNIGGREAYLAAAVVGLRGHGIEVLAASALYETEPVGELLDQRDFVNAAVRIRTGLEPEALLDVCKAVEVDLGRRPGGPRHAPRPIDIDLLLLGELIVRTPRLQLPHPEVCSRRFVLTPLLELDPSLTLPDGTALDGALAALGPGQAVRRLGGTLMEEKG